jgi:predicted RNA-binding protein with PIN domain
MNIIIDGYNLIRQSEVLRRFESQGLEEGRTELIRRIVQFKKARGHRVTIVFDGWEHGADREERYKESGVTIIFSRRGETADDVIKRMVTRGSECLVVTSDRGIADAVTRHGGVAVASVEFELKMQMSSLGLSPLDEKEDESEALYSDDTRGTARKKGPSKRLPKKKRRQAARLKKL